MSELKKEGAESDFAVIASWVPFWFTVLVVSSLIVIAAPGSSVKFYSLVAAAVSAPLFMYGFLGKLAKLEISGRG